MVLAALAVGFVLGACDEFFVEPDPTPSGLGMLSVAYELDAALQSESTPAEVFDRVDQVFVQVRDIGRDTALWDGPVGHTRTSDGVVLDPIDLTLPEEGGLNVTVDLRWKGASLFRGSSQVQIVKGGTVPAPTISVAATPAKLVIRELPALSALGTTTQAVADVLFATEDPIPGAEVSWSSSHPSVVSVSSQGMLTAEAEGVATITATHGLLASAVPVTVGVEVDRVVISPVDPGLLDVGAVVSFSAMALSADDKPLNRTIEWSSSDALVAEVTALGLATATGAGSAEIYASAGGQTSSVALTVVGSVAGITTLPPAAVGTAVARLSGQFPAGGGATSVWFEYGPGADTTAHVKSPAQAPPGGAGVYTYELSGLSSETTYSYRAVADVSGTPVYGELAQFQTLAASLPISQVLVSPTAPAAEVGDTLTFSALALDASGGAVSSAVTWTTSDADVATIDSEGMLVVQGPGTTVVQATMSGVAGTTVLTATALPATVVVVSPNAPTAQLGDTVQFSAVALNVLGDTVPASFTWATSIPGVATVNESGLAVVTGVGVTTITADMGVLFGTTTLAGLALPIVSVTVSPNNPSAQVGDTVQFSAVAEDALSQEVTTGFTWTSSDESVATIDPSGQVIVVGPGSAEIKATADGVTGSSVLSSVAPTPLLTRPADSIKVDEANLNGSLFATGGWQGWLEWGTVNDPEQFDDSPPKVWTLDGSEKKFHHKVEGLTSNTTYYFRAAATDGGVAEAIYGEVLSFTTPPF